MADIDMARVNKLMEDAATTMARIHGISAEAGQLLEASSRIRVAGTDDLERKLSLTRKASSMMREESDECIRYASILRRVADIWEPHLDDMQHDIDLKRKRGFT